MPIWAAILIALVSGLLGTIARISYERAAEMRTRAIEAADEFAVAAVRSFELVWKATSDCEQREEDARDAVATATEAVEDLERRATRLHLLLGPYTEPSYRAMGVSTQLKIALASLEPWPPEVDSEDLELGDDEDFDAESDDHVESDSDEDVEYPGVLESEIEDEIAEARMWEHYALNEFTLFKASAADHLHTSAWRRRLRRPWKDRGKQPWRLAEKRLREYPYGKPPERAIEE